MPTAELTEERVEPECLYISSALDSGRFTPTTDGLNIDCFEEQSVTYNFIRRYLKRTGKMPPKRMVKEQYPQFQYTKGVAHSWAVSAMRHQLREKDVKSVAIQALKHLEAGDVDKASSALAGYDQNRWAQQTKKIMFGDESLFKSDEAARTPLAGTKLNEMLGGIYEGQMGTIAARPSVGKSFMMVRQAVVSATAGWDAVLFSMEMSEFLCNDRIARVIIGPSYSSMTEKERIQEIVAWKNSVKGSIQLVTPSVGTVTPDLIASCMGRNKIMIVDHMGLMKTNEGLPQTDHTISKLISNQIKSLTMSHKSPILIAAQLNRMGELANTDAITQDSDFIVFLSRPSEEVTYNDLVKSRNGISARWYSRFNVADNDFSDMTDDKARMVIDKETIAKSAYTS